MKPRPPSDCRRGKGCPPPDRFLLPRILASGSEWRHHWCTQVEVQGVDPCAPPPFVLVSVEASQARVVREEGDQAQIEAEVLCHVRDGAGCTHTGTACICLWVRVCRHWGREDDGCGQWIASVCARLICQPPCAPCPSFEAALQVKAQAFWIRWETCASGRPRPPECPPLPLYPPPCRWERH